MATKKNAKKVEIKDLPSGKKASAKGGIIIVNSTSTPTMDGSVRTSGGFEMPGTTSLATGVNRNETIKA
jgi:hypothetical protein